MSTGLPKQLLLLHLPGALAKVMQPGASLLAGGESEQAGRTAESGAEAAARSPSTCTPAGWSRPAWASRPTSISSRPLTWFRDHDMNGNGDAGDEIPFGMRGRNIEQLMSIFGVVDAQSHRMVIDDKVMFTADEPEGESCHRVVPRHLPEGADRPRGVHPGR